MGSYRGIVGRDQELAVLSAAMAGAAAGRGGLVLVEGAPGIGKTTLLRAVCADAEVLTARGLALEGGFSFGIVRQLIEPVRAAAGPGEWDALLDGAAGLAARVFDGAEPGAVEDDVPYAVMHGLYWLVANLAATAAGRGPLVIAVDDAHWADVPSLRWLAHLAARIEGLPVALLLAVRDDPGQPAMIRDVVEELRACPAGTALRLGPLAAQATAALVRQRLDERADDRVCQACHARTGGNPFLLEALVSGLRAPGGGDLLARVDRLGPEPVAQAVLRRVGQFGDGAVRLTRALAILGGPAPLRHAAALTGQDAATAARLADRLRAADVLAPGGVLEFAHPIVRTAVYDSIPSGERALAHAEAARLLDGEGADPERIVLHLLRSEPAGDARVVALLRVAATAASGRGAPSPAAQYLRRALDEPPDLATRPAVLLQHGLALASERDPAAVTALRQAVALTETPGDRAAAALLAARLLGIWGYHDSVALICRDALAAGPDLGPAADGLEAELFASSFISTATAGQAWTRAGSHLADPGAASMWRVYDAVLATGAAQPVPDALARLAPVLDGGFTEIPPDSLAAVYTLLVLIWNGDLGLASTICDGVLSAARTRGSMSMVAHASCLRSMINRRLGRLEDAAADARLGLDFKLATSPPLAVAWAAAFCIEALTDLGRLAEAEAVAAAVADAGREPPAGWIHTALFRQARGALRVAQQRPDAALDDLTAAAADWRGLFIDNPAMASWRTAAAAAHAALGQRSQAAAMAGEQLALARKAGNPATIGASLRAHAAVTREHPGESLAEAVSLLEPTEARHELALALADLGTHLRQAGRRSEAQAPLRRALDLAQRTGAAPLADQARRELLATGARPRRAALTGPDALTSAERRVADLAANGMSNRQIAQHLFITLPTVETHLRHAFGKLGITSRAGLPAALRLYQALSGFIRLYQAACRCRR
jgi:DNA-binding CsgD family transcriptional regulator